MFLSQARNNPNQSTCEAEIVSDRRMTSGELRSWSVGSDTPGRVSNWLESSLLTAETRQWQIGDVARRVVDLLMGTVAK